MSMSVTTVPAPYVAPEIDFFEADLTEEEAIWWGIVVGGSFAAALAYASYCTSRGGSPSISFGWSGFRVSCYR